MEVLIDTPFITLQSVLKLSDVISSGGMAKMFLQEEEVKINGIRVFERGKKIYPGDVVLVRDKKIVITRKSP